MNFLEKITGSDMKHEMKEFDSRAAVLPKEYQTLWNQVVAELWNHGDLTGRSLMPVMDGVLGLFEESAAEGLLAAEVLDGDVVSFCTALTGRPGAADYRAKWRMQLNASVHAKLGR